MPLRKLLAVPTLSCVIVFIAAGVGWAQNFERYRPRAIDPPPTSPAVPTQRVPAATGSDDVLVERLNAVIVRDDPAAVDPTNSFADATGIVYEFSGSKSLVYSKEFKAIVSSYLGLPITLRKLNQMSRDIIVMYRGAGEPVVDVVVPEQKITAGTIQIVIRESRIGKVRVKGGCWTDPCRLADKILCTQSGNRLYEWSLNNDLRRLNDSPFRRVEVDLKPGKFDGTTDVIFDVNDVFPVRGYFGYDDTGVQNLKLDRIYAGFVVGNPFRHDGTLSFQSTFDDDFNRLVAHSLFYSVDLNSCWSLDTYGSWAAVDPIVAVGTNQTGESWQAGFALNRKLIDRQYEKKNISVGFDFKSTNTNVEFGGATVFDSKAELTAIRFGYEHLRFSCNGDYCRVNNDLYVGPGAQFSPSNTAAAFNTVRQGTSPDFVYDRLRADCLKTLPNCWQLNGRFSGQVASERLLFSETLGFGGYDTIRGYDQRTLNGDAGWIANLELGPRPCEYGCSCRRSSLRLYGFVDAGDSYILDALPGEDQQKFLISAGVGMRYTINNRLSLRLDYGHGFRDVSALASSNTQRLHLGVVSFLGRVPGR